MIANRDEGDVEYEKVWVEEKKVKEREKKKRVEDFSKEDVIKMIEDKLSQKIPILKIREDLINMSVDDKLLEESFVVAVQVNLFLFI